MTENTNTEFFKNLVRAYQKYEEKEKANEKLNKHIEKVKILSLNKETPQKKIK